MKELRIIIVEDEAATARNLAYLLQRLYPDLSIVTTLDSVSVAISWFNENQDAYDLIFMDIRLADGLSFDIFKETAINKPVVFVTAYNDYAMQAFKNNGIDYILKPFDELEIKRAVDKFKNWMGNAGTEPTQPLTQLLEQLNNLNKTYKRSFLVHHRDKLLPIETAKIAWFYTANEIVYAYTTDGKQYVIEYTIEQLEHQVDPKYFFRANRQFIVNRQAICEVEFYFNGRLSLRIKPEPPEHVLISKARVPEFKCWMNS